MPFQHTSNTKLFVELLLKISFRERLTEILLMVPALGTMMLTYYGISVTMGEVGVTIVQKGQALAFSIAIGVFAWLGWFYLFGLLPHLNGKRLAGALTAGCVYIGVLSAIDAPFNMLALAGGASVQMSLADTTIAYEEKRDEVFVRAAVAQRLIPGIRAQAKRFQALEEGEITHGTYSGRKGPGKVSSGFGQINTLLDTLAKDLELGFEKAKDIQKEVAAHFAELKAQTYRQGPIRPRVEAATIAADRIDDLLGQLAQHDYSASITTTLASLREIFPTPTVASSAFEKAQNTELTVIAAMARPVADALGDSVAELQKHSKSVVKKVRPQNAHTAIYTYWRPLLAEWCAAFFIDLAPIALLIILIAARREQQNYEASDDGRMGSSNSDSLTTNKKGITK